MECGMHELSYNRDIFNNAGNPVAIKIYKTMILPKNNVFSLQTGLEKVKKGGFAFHLDSTVGYRILKGMFNYPVTSVFRTIEHISESFSNIPL